MYSMPPDLDIKSPRHATEVADDTEFMWGYFKLKCAKFDQSHYWPTQLNSKIEWHLKNLEMYRRAHFLLKSKERAALLFLLTFFTSNFVTLVNSDPLKYGEGWFLPIFAIILVVVGSVLVAAVADNISQDLREIKTKDFNKDD